MDRNGREIWCIDDNKPADGQCALGQHTMGYSDEVFANEAAKPLPPAFISVLQELTEERRRQRDQHGWTAAHDDELKPHQWAWLFMQRTTTLLAPTVRPQDVRRCLVEMAAIATAAIEAADRAKKEQGF